MQNSYRPDIDCLRAIAVLSVIGFHWNIPPFSGGYVGVYVFFVISGFLDHGDHLSRDRRRDVLLCVFLRETSKAHPSSFVRDDRGSRGRILVYFIAAHLQGPESGHSGNGSLPVEYLILARGRIFRDFCSGQASAPHLVPVGRGAILSGPALRHLADFDGAKDRRAPHGCRAVAHRHRVIRLECVPTPSCSNRLVLPEPRPRLGISAWVVARYQRLKAALEPTRHGGRAFHWTVNDRQRDCGF